MLYLKIRVDVTMCLIPPGPPLPDQARIKGLVGPSHFVIFAEPNKKFKALFKAISFILCFLGPFFLSFNLRSPIFLVGPRHFA